MPFKGSLEDRIAIRELLESYSDAVTQRDGKAWAACWAEGDDSCWRLPDLKGWAEINGKESIVREWHIMMDAFHGPGGEPAVCTFICIPGNLTVDGDSAQGRSYTTEMFVDGAGRTRETKGQYDDRFVREGGRWLFRERNWTLFAIADHEAIRG